jgi:hypothetical protein
MDDGEILLELMAAKEMDDGTLAALGLKVGKLFTDMGLPIDMALDNIDLPKNKKLAVLDGACTWLIEHKRNSGATDKAIERQRKTNREWVTSFCKSGEVGAY